MTLGQAVVLGVVQGLTEFLPVSSSGHLALTRAILGVHGSYLAFDVALHVGTLLAVLWALRQDLARILRGLARPRQAGEDRRLLPLLIVGTLPAGLAGLFFHDLAEQIFGSILVPPIMLLVTGALLWAAQVTTARGRWGLAEMPYRTALWVGLGQALAILPGLSRSGTTLTFGLWAGLQREAAARFSFLLSIPTILGAAVLELPDALAASVDPWPLLAGVLAAAITGYLAVRWLLAFIRAGDLRWFAAYTWLIGTGALLWILR